MYHILSPNELYDIVNEQKITLDMYKGKEKIDIAQFLDDVSVWMDGNRVMISDNYIPLSVMSVGVMPVQVSAFLYGVFVAKAMEKHKLKVKTTTTKVDRDTIMKEIEANIDFYDKLLGDNPKGKVKEK